MVNAIGKFRIILMGSATMTGKIVGNLRNAWNYPNYSMQKIRTKNAQKYVIIKVPAGLVG